MSAKAYRNLVRIAAVCLGALVAASIALELPLYVPLIGFMVTLVLAVVFRRSVKEVLSDERNRRIEEKATSAAYRIFTVFAAALALAGMMLRGILPEWAGTAAETLAYSVCVLMLTHLASSRYYSSKL